VTDIASLSDMEAVRVLALMVDRASPLPDPAHQREIESRLRQAVEKPDTEPADGPVSAGDLARAALHHLATRPDNAALIVRAAEMPPQQSRFDTATLLIGALVVLALQTEVDLTRNEDGRWKLHIHKQPMRDSTTIATLISKLMAFYRPPER
jgi:hypothetical protein